MRGVRGAAAGRRVDAPASDGCPARRPRAAGPQPCARARAVAPARGICGVRGVAAGWSPCVGGRGVFAAAAGGWHTPPPLRRVRPCATPRRQVLGGRRLWRGAAGSGTSGDAAGSRRAAAAEPSSWYRQGAQAASRKPDTGRPGELRRDLSHPWPDRSPAGLPRAPGAGARTAGSRLPSGGRTAGPPRLGPGRRPSRHRAPRRCIAYCSISLPRVISSRCARISATLRTSAMPSFGSSSHSRSTAAASNS